MASTDQIRILIISDSHGDRAIVEDIKERYLGQVDAIFHNGDSELPADDPLWEGIHVVKGNCDYDDYPETLVVDLGAVRIAQTHGHLQGINFSWRLLDYWAQQEEATVCLYGHLHVPDVTLRGETLFVNPGSVSQPRGLVQECLYGLLTITPQTFQMTYYTREHEVYAPLTKEIKR